MYADLPISNENMAKVEHLMSQQDGPPATDAGVLAEFMSNPEVSPLRQSERDFCAMGRAGLKFHVHFAEHDNLCDESVRYVERLKTAGVEVSRSRCDGAMHGWFQMASSIGSNLPRSIFTS